MIKIYICKNRVVRTSFSLDPKQDWVLAQQAEK